jgi:superfamily I DNA/RNA helicase
LVVEIHRYYITVRVSSLARMIPDLLPETIENNGERIFYDAARRLPNEYTVFYSYKYYIEGVTMDQIREADFVIVHPVLGFAVVEVKQGEIGFLNGQWQEFKYGTYQPLSKDPLEQARSATFKILDVYKSKTGGKSFPLKFRYAMCFPECSKITGVIPQSVKEESIWTLNDLEALDKKIWDLFDVHEKRQERNAIDELIQKVLSPTFKLFSTLEDQIQIYKKTAQIVLTEEQERILDETEEDRHKIFFGAAGTGKTFIAMEKARRLAEQGKRVFLTCYNKNLTKVFTDHIQHPNIVAQNFHDYIYEQLEATGHDLTRDQDALDTFFKIELPDLALEYFEAMKEDEKFDSIIVDEGQDFTEEWFLCLEAMQKRSSDYYIFADPNQNLFGPGVDILKKFPASKHRLTINLRNTEKINDWLTPFLEGKITRSKLTGGIPVTPIKWKDPSEEKRLIEKEIGRLVSQGLNPSRILILSPNRKEKSCLNEVERIREWPLVDFKESSNGIKFATIRSFKGLEADVVILIGVKENSKVCTPEDVYVGASRARYLLYVFHHEDWQGNV